MAITTLEGIANGIMQPKMIAKSNGATVTTGALRSLFYTGSTPEWVASTANTSGLSGSICTNNTIGALLYNNHPSGNTYLANCKLSRPDGYAGLSPIIICDRLWHNSNIDRTLTTEQTINSISWPARDINETTNGEGVYIGIEVSSPMGTGAPVVTINYTNSIGESGKIGTNINSIVASISTGAFYILSLAAGDTGVRSIQSITFSSSWGTQGTVHLVAFRPITFTDYFNLGGQYGVNNDAITLGMPRVFNNSCLMLCTIAPNSGFNAYYGYIQLTQG